MKAKAADPRPLFDYPDSDSDDQSSQADPQNSSLHAAVDEGKPKARRFPKSEYINLCFVGANSDCLALV